MTSGHEIAPALRAIYLTMHCGFDAHFARYGAAASWTAGARSAPPATQGRRWRETF